MAIQELDDNISRKPTVKGVFMNADYFKLWVSQFISNVGSNISLIVLPLFIFQYTGSTFWLGIITLAEFVPVLIFSPIAGMFVDTHDRKKTMITSDLLCTILILLIPLLIVFDKQLPEISVLTGITILVFLQAVSIRFFIESCRLIVYCNLQHRMNQLTFELILLCSSSIFQIR